MCSNARGGEGEGASRPPCTTHASGQSTMYKASRLIYSFLAYFTYIVIQRAGSALLQAIDVFYVHYRPILYLCTLVQCAIQAALKAASHHSQSSVLFLCSLSQHHVIISELSAISIQTAMFATLNLPTSAYPLLQLDWNNIAHTKSIECEMFVVKPRESNPKLCWQWKVCTPIQLPALASMA